MARASLRERIDRTELRRPRIVEGGMFDGLDEADVDAFVSAVVDCVLSAARHRGIPPPEPAENDRAPSD